MTNTRKIGATGLSVLVLNPSMPPKPKRTPAEVARWCASLPMADTGACAKKLFIALDETSNTDMSATERFDILELFRDPNKSICTALKRHYIEQKSPLTERKLTIATLRETLISYMADNYKLVLEGLHQKNINSHDDKALKATVLVRILYYMNVLLICRYQLYMHAPENVWKEIHLIYNYAKINDLLDLQVKCKFSSKKQMTSVLEAYTRILLLSATDPYQWRQKEQHSINKAIELWASYPSICEYPNIPKTTSGVYIIDLDKDEPPNLVSFKKGPITQSCIALDLSKEVQHLKSILEKMQHNHLKARIDNPNDPEFSVTVPTISKLINIWSQHIVRATERLPIKAEIKVAFSLAAAYYYINGEKEFNPHHPNLNKNPSDNNQHKSQYNESLPVFEVSDADDEGDAASSTTQNITENITAQENASDSNKKDVYSITNYTIENTSRGGFCIVIHDKSFPPFQAGELIIFKYVTEEPADWGIGAIRWLRRLNNHEFHIGIQIIAPYAKAARIQILRGEKAATRLLRCLVLPENIAEKIPPMLITTSLPFHANTVMLYLDDAEPIKATLTKEIDASGMYYLYEYASEATVNIKNNNDNNTTTPTASHNEDGDAKTNTEFDSIWGDL